MNTLEAYLPQDRRRTIAANVPLPEQADGSVLFADISGFTPLTEALSHSLGARRGAEETTRQLNLIYHALIARIEQFGGSVISFSGDAMTCWFPALPEGGPQPEPGRQKDEEAAISSSFRAVGCALALQEAMAQFAAVRLPDGQTTAIGLKVAVATGSVRRWVVGDPAVRLIDTIAGSTVARPAQAEHLAQPGEVLIDQVTAAALGAQLEIGEWRDAPGTGERFAVVKKFASPAFEFPNSFDVLPALNEAQLRPWLHPAVYRHHLLDEDEFLTELRPVAALFVRFTGIDFDRDADAGTRLDHFVRHVQHLLARYEGDLLELTIGDKGSYFYGAFGALSAHEDDAQRAVRAAWELLHLPSDLDCIASLQMGVSQGVIRVGAYGGDTRRVYGAQGDEVNLAARLMMQAAPGQVLISARIQKANADEFDLEPQPPIRLKGKAEPLLPFAVKTLREAHPVRLNAPHAGLPLIGRERERQQLQTFLETARRRRGQIIGITAEAGIGKSRLVAEVMNQARRAGCQIYCGDCQSFGVHSAYLVWVPIWRAFFGVDSNAPASRQLRALSTELQALAPERVQALPLLNAVLDLALPENDFTRDLEPEYRKSALEAMLVECVGAVAQESAAQGQALLLVLDDIHWIDPASLELLERLATSIAELPVLIILAYRPFDPTRPSPRANLAQLPYFTQIELSELDQAQSEALIRARLAQLAPENIAPVPPELIEQITTRAQGNPFYIQELLNYMHDRGLSLRDPAAFNALDVPDSLHRLLLSRIDRLEQGQQLTLKAASVIGRTFSLEHLTGYFPRLGVREEIVETLNQLQRADLVFLDQPDPDPAYLFKHIVTQQVAYESMSFSAREHLHEQYAQFLEASALPERNLDLLAYHYDHSANAGKRREYLRRAGQAAAARFVNAQALDYLTRALALIPPNEHAERYELLAARERVLEILGERERQRVELTELEQLTDLLSDTGKRLGVILRQGWLAEQVADYARAIELTQRAIAATGRLAADAPLADRVLTEAYALWGQVLWRQGDAVSAEQYVRRVLELARASGNQASRAWALDRLGTLARERGNNAAALELHQQALELARAIGDRRREAMALNNLAAVATLRGEQERAIASYMQALRSVREIGDRLGEALLLSNLAYIHLDRGEYDQAISFSQQSLDLANAIGDRQRVQWVMVNLGEVYRLIGDYANARSWTDRALAMAREQGNRLSEAFALMNLDAIALDQGESDEARRRIQDGLPLVQEVDYREGEAFLLYTLGAVGWTTGHPVEARAAFEQALGIWETLEPSPYILQAHAGLAEIARSEATPQGSEQAARHVQAILDHAAAHPAHASDPAALAAYLTCYRVLTAQDDARASTVLQTAHRLLQERAGKIGNAAQRRSFLENVRAHRAIVEESAAAEALNRSLA